MTETWGSRSDLQTAKADDWFAKATQSTEEFLRGLGWQGAQSQPDATSLDIALPTAEAFHASAPWRDLDPTPAPILHPSAPQAPPVSPLAGITPARPVAASGTPVAMPTGAPSAAPGGAGTPGEIDNSSREAFVRSAYPHALQAADGDPKLAQQLLATAISENGKVGTGKSLGEMGFNVGGIQGVKGTAGSFTAMDAGRPREFAAYNTLGEGFRAVRDLVSGGRYAQAASNYQQTGDIDRYWREVNQAGYSETPDWQDRIAAIRRSQVEPITAGLSPAAPTAAAPTAAGSPSSSPAAESSRSAAGAYTAGSYTPNQIESATGEGLDYETALAVCGPAAAIAFARKAGRNPTMQEAVGLARQVGWTVGEGMAGPASQQRLLQSMGVAARLHDGAPDWGSVAADVQRGNPVIISTRGHYFVAERYDPASGQFDFGNSAAVLKAAGGRRWFKPEEIASLGMGAPRASLYMDSPQSPSPSVVAGSSAPTAGASQPAGSPSPSGSGAPPTAAGSAATQDAYKLSDTMPPDEPTVSPGDQKRARLVAMRAGQPSDEPTPDSNAPNRGRIIYQDPDNPQPMPGNVYTNGVGPEGLPDVGVSEATGIDQQTGKGLGETPHFSQDDMVYPVNTPGLQDREGQPQIVPRAGAAWPAGAGTSYGAAPGTMYRQPLQATGGPDSSTGADEPTSSYNDPTDTGTLSRPLPSQAQPSVADSAIPAPNDTTPQIVSDEKRNVASDDPGGAQFAAQDAYSTPQSGSVSSTSDEGRNQEPFTPPPGLQAVYDAGGRFLHWIQGAAQNVAHQINPVQPDASYLGTLGQGAANVAAGLTPGGMTPGQYAQAVTPRHDTTVAPEAALRDVMDASANARNVLPSANRAIDETVDSARPAFQAGGQELSDGQIAQGLYDLGRGALDVANSPFTVGAASIDALLPTMANAPVSMGTATTNLSLIHDVRSLVNAGIRITPKVVDALRNGTAVDDLIAMASRGANAAANTIDAGIEGAQSAGRGIRGALDANAERVGAADARMAETGSTTATGTLGISSDTRMYHGTASAFERPDPERFDPQGLYGPGYYLTSDPRVANSYAVDRNFSPGGVTPLSELRARRLADQLKDAEREASRPGLSQRDQQAWDQHIADLHAQIDQVTSQGPNVRAVDAPSGLNLLDAEQPLTPDEIGRIRAIIPDQVDQRLFEATRARYDDPNSVTAVRAALDDVAQGWHERSGNTFLARAGFDGIAYDGGQIMPLKDAAGQDVRHQATVIFPEAIGKLRNSFSGEVGGATLGVVPPSRGSSALDAVTTEAGRMVAGGVGGATLGAGAPADTPEERRRNALIGAGIGMVAGPLASRAIKSEGGALATFGASPHYRPPTAAELKAAEAQGARRGEMLNRPVTAPDTVMPRLVRAATAATDNRAGMRWAEDILSDAAGRPRMRENDPARPSTQSRVNSGSVANERIETGLAPAVQDAGAAGLQHELPQYLEDTHQKDILDAFYTRGKQKVLDERTAAIAASQAKGVAPAVIARMQAKAEADAEAAGVAAMHTREAGSMTYPQIEARLQAQEQRVTAAGKKSELDAAAQAVWDHNAETRQRLVDSGNLDPQVAADLAATYPHYVPTVPISHLTEGGGPVASSSTAVSRGTKPSISALEDVGTSGERLNPIVASRNSTISAERDIQRNNVARAFAQMMDNATAVNPAATATNAATHRTLLGGGVDVHYFENGVPKTLSVPKTVADGLEAASNMGMSSNGVTSFLKRVTGVVTSTLTAARASFVPVNVARDASDYATRTMVREGNNPAKLPAILGTWADEAGKAARDILASNATGRTAIGAATGFGAGALQGDDQTPLSTRLVHGAEGAAAGALLLGANKVQATGKAAEYLARGGGSGAAVGSLKAGQRWYRDVLSSGGTPLKTPGEAMRYLGDWAHDVVSLQGVKGINERAETISRTAAMRRAESRGSGPVEAMLAGRDSSYDPDRAGTVTRAWNGFIPFLNATVQGGAQFGRMMKQNPVATTAAIGATLGPVMLATEYWNRSDPQRAQAYDDVPQYVKDSGIVLMMPGAGGSDTRGQKPNYLWLPTEVLTPFVVGMRAAMQHADAVVPGMQPSAGRSDANPNSVAPQALGALNEALSVFYPVRGDSAASIGSTFVPPIAKQAIELGQNKDLFRGGTISSPSQDERASGFAHTVAGAANTAGRAFGNDLLQNVTPSHVDYLARQVPAYGDIITGASDMVKPSPYKQAEQGRLANEPFVGGVASRFVRDAGGSNLERSQGQVAGSPDLQAALQDARMRPSEVDVTVPSSVGDLPLNRDEQLEAQNRMNDYLPEELAKAQSSPKWGDPLQAQALVKAAISRAQTRATTEIIRTIPRDEQNDRKRQQMDAKQAVGR